MQLHEEWHEVLWLTRQFIDGRFLEYKDRLDQVKAWLETLENLTYVGRPGRFRYTNQDHSLEMGILASRTILEGRKYDLDTIGAENEYFEKGPIYEKRI